MSRLVVAGAWTIETNNSVGNDILGSQRVSDRLTYLAEVLKGFDVFCRTVSGWKDYAEGELFVFVAPEYYFKSSKLDVERCLTKKERDDIVEAFVEFSYAYPHTVIIPGTIIWSKPVDDKSRKKAQTRVKEAMQTKGITEALKPKWDALSRRGDGRVQYVSYNSAYIFCCGYKYKYHKMNDATENLDGDLANGTLFIPGSKPGYFPDLGKTGLDFGIEICADHQSAVLNQTVDIHVLCSASTSTNKASIRARPGGLFIHASSSHTDFYFNNAGNFESPQALSIPYNAKDFLSQEKLDEQKTAFLKEKENKAVGVPLGKPEMDFLSRTFNVKAARGQLDYWVAEMNR
jgi:hypothetical protein